MWRKWSSNLGDGEGGLEGGREEGGGSEDDHRGWLLMGEGGESKSGMTLITGHLGEELGRRERREGGFVWQQLI